MLSITLDILNGPTIQERLEMSDIAVTTLSSGVSSGYGALVLKEGDTTYAHLLIWSYWQHGKIWHEVLLQNCSIEQPAGYYEANYVIEIDLFGKNSTIEREEAQFYDGTGYVEYFGEPFIAPVPGSMEFYNRYVPDNEKPLFDAYMNENVVGLSSYPHINWSASDWCATLFDSARNTHTTGSPRNVGANWDQGTAVALLWSRLNNLPEANIEEKEAIVTQLKKLTANIFGHIGQQSRRPIHFLHDEKSRVFSGADYTYPKTLVMGEFGPSRLWGANVLWGRDKLEDTRQGPWNGWDHEHISVDWLVVGYLFYGSQYCFMQIRLLLEALITHPHLKDIKKTHSARVWGWGFKALSWGLYVNPFALENLRYKKSLQILMDSYTKYAVYQPIPYVFEQPADGRHIYPTAAQMLEWYTWFTLVLPNNTQYNELMEAYQTGQEEADRDLAEYLVNHIYHEYGGTELSKCLDYFGWVAGFHIATMAAGVNLYNDMHKGGNSQIYQIAQHILQCLLLKCRNKEGTFWGDYGTQNPYATAGNGVSKDGVNAWTAGGVGLLWSFLPVQWHKDAKDAIFSVYLDNKYTKPGAEFFASWFLPTAYYLGY